MKKVKNSGITLIALIITIIVLLILAGVSISMVAGDNGILTQAVNAADSNNLAEVKSDLSLALASCQTNYFADRYVDEGTDANVADYFTTDKIKTEMGSDYSNVEGIINIGLESTLKITKTDGKIYIAVILISDNAGIIISNIFEKIGIIASDIADNPTTYYGLVVTDYTVADSDLQDDLDDEGIQWKIFYADDSNIYLISSDYVPVENAPANSNGDTPFYSSDYPYNLYLNQVYSTYSGASNITDNHLIKWNNLYLSSYSDSTNTNMKCVAYLMDTSLWSNYTNTSYAIYTIGSPTLEIWIASWNDKLDDSLYCNVTNSYGYKINDSSAQYVATSDTLYFPHTSSWNSCNGYWLSSPSYYRSNALVYVSSSGGFVGNYLDTSWSGRGFRPLVCLSSDIQLVDNGNGTCSIIQ